MSIDTEGDARFVAEVRAFLTQNLSVDMAARGRADVHPSREDMLGVTALLARAGWSVPNWPEAHGGPGWSAWQRYLFEDELMRAGAPANNIQGVSLVGPVIYSFGTPAQQARYLPAIREGREFWAQGFSEPGSGSDLASLRTLAVREGEGPDAVYVVNGQKIWTSQAFMADMLFCLVRTDTQAKAQRGISFLLIPMRSPGIQVRPIQSIDEGESLCEVFLDDVRVPVENLIGEEGRGWDYAKFLLGHERVTTADVPRNKRYLSTLVQMARHAPSALGDGTSLYDDPVFRSRIGKLEIDLIALEAAAVGTIEFDDTSPLTPSALKIHGTELMQALLGLQVECLGLHAAAFVPHGITDADAPCLPAPASSVNAEYLFRRAATIYGGSTEIQKNIISKLLLNGQLPAPAPLTEDQTLLQHSAERFAAASHEEPWRDFAAGDPDLARARWRRLADTGFLGLGTAESAGGLGGSNADVAVVCEALGHGGVAQPLGACWLAPSHLLARADWPAERRRAAVERLAAGSWIVALAHGEVGAARRADAVRAQSRGDRIVLNGRLTAVMGGAVADAFIVRAHWQVAEGGPETPALFLVPRDVRGLACGAYRALDGQVMADVELADVELDVGALIDAGQRADAHLDEAAALAIVMGCADAVGTMDTLFAITLDYLQTRRQFGSTLSAFQALQHRLAEMYGELAIARAMLRRAVGALDEGGTEAMRLASAAKSRIGRAAFFIGSQAVQLHGGIGMTQECAVGRHFKHLHVLEAVGGSGPYHAHLFVRHARTNVDAGEVSTR